MTANIRLTQILLKRGNTTAASAYTGPIGEVVIDTGLQTLRIQDGVTPGGQIIQTSAGDDTSFSADFNDGLNDNVFRFINVKGAKSFDFETEGNKYLELTLTGLQVAD